SADCLAQESHGADTLRNPEPSFYILGSKSYGRNTTFLLRVGWDQVDEVFSLFPKTPVQTDRVA
ncbi:MAG: flavoprotein, partial [Longimicrobiales bacterium]